ncbi:MAG: hypothetical protein Q9213_007855 [Squamulea squamosa]
MISNDPNVDSAVYQGCYLWTLDKNAEPAKRAVKRRRVTMSSIHSEQHERIYTVPLLQGKETQENVQMRSALFEESWHPQERIIHVQEFFDSSTSLTEEHDVMVVNIDPSQITNLKSALKHINGHVMGVASPIEEDDLPKHGKSGRKWNYDLQILYDHVRSQSIQKIIITFHDSETFNGALLNDIIEVIKIPFVCLFGIKTSVELFQEKLRRTIIQCLHGAQFEVAQIDVDSIFKNVSSLNQGKLFWLGSGVTNLILQAQQHSIHSIASFTRSLQYAHMTHIFANPLSVLLKDPFPHKIFPKEIYEGVRNLNSFRQHAEDLLDQKDFDTARRLLGDNVFLHEQIKRGIKKSKGVLEGLVSAVELLAVIQESLNIRATESWCNLYIKAMAGQLKDSPVVKENLLAVRKLSSDAMARLLGNLGHSPLTDIPAVLDDLQQLQAENQGAEPLRSEHDTHYAGLRTTIVSHKVELSKQSASLSKQDLSYSQIVNRIDNILVKYFQEVLINPQELFLHEILIYDFKSPHREVFAAKPRHAMERALSSPRDYLGCNCCRGTQHGLSATHPATSILYQLFLESGAIINTSDLWSAFNIIVGSEDHEDEEDEHERTLALFSQALAELKYMGMITSSRKKADHLAKTMWNGL